MRFVCNLSRIMRLFDFGRNYAKNYASIIRQGLGGGGGGYMPCILLLLTLLVDLLHVLAVNCSAHLPGSRKNIDI